MDRYCTCNRGIGYSNRTSVVTSSNGLDVCSHCGGIVPPESSYDYEPPSDPNMLKFKNIDYDEPYYDYFEQAEECCLDGDHSAAIELYEKAFKVTWNNLEKCNALAGIAGEYEAMGDYASAEEYWMRCCRDTTYDSYKFIAGRGDFLYRRWRHEEAIEAYEEVLKELNERDYKKFYLNMCKNTSTSLSRG